VSGLAHLGGPRPAAPNLERSDDWRQEAACRPGTGVELAWFFPDKTDTFHNRDLEANAKATCQSCPVRQACLEWALPRDEHGIFGGLTAKERSSLKRRQQRASPPSRGAVALPREHGTSRGYGQHRYLKEEPCVECLHGVNEIRRERRRQIAAAKRWKELGY
jgi:hypothetical protein